MPIISGTQEAVIGGPGSRLALAKIQDNLEK
jgi:hypothetical protein